MSDERYLDWEPQHSVELKPGENVLEAIARAYKKILGESKMGRNRLRVVRCPETGGSRRYLEFDVAPE